MALSANRELNRYVDQELRTYPVASGKHVYKGAIVGLDSSGYARGLVAGDQFVGVAYEEADNSSGSDGDLDVRVYTQGDFLHALSGASRANNGSAVFASDDETVTTTPGSNSPVGTQIDVPETGKIVLRTRALPLPSGGGRHRSVTKTSSATLAASELNGVVFVNNSAAVTLTLPAVASAGPGAWVGFVKVSAAAQVVTLDGNSSETINGSATNVEMDAQFDSILLVTDGTAWFIAAKNIA